MLFGLRRSILFAPLPAEDAGAPAGGGAALGSPAPGSAPVGSAAAGAAAPAGAPAGGAAPASPPKPPEVPPTVDLESPAIKELLRKHGEAEAAKAATAARLAALAEASAAAEEEKRVAAMDAETRAKHDREQLKQEAATAKGDKTKAENAAAAAAREAAIFRQISISGLVPQDDDVAAMIAAAAPKDLVPGDTGWLVKLATEKPYLFKSTEVRPGTATPAEIVGAGRTTAPAASPAAAAPASRVTDSYKLTDAEWDERKKKLGLRLA